MSSNDDDHIYEPEPKEFANAYQTVTGQMLFVDAEYNWRWISCDPANVMEVLP